MDEDKTKRKRSDISQSYNCSGVIVETFVLVLSHFVMVAVMTMTPIYMQRHGATLTAAGLVIGLHIASSLGTGVLVDRIGRTRMVIVSSMTLGLAGLMSAFVLRDSIILMTIALVLLGVGWDFGLISGTAIIVDSTSVLTRAKIQGSIYLWVAFGGTAGSILLGIIVAYMSCFHLGIIGAIIAILLIPLIVWTKKK